MTEEFSIGDLKVIPKYDLRRYLHGYDESDVIFAIDYAKYGQFRPKFESKSLFFSPMVEDVCLIPFRLSKAGWLSAMTVFPITESSGIEIRCGLDIDQHLFSQIWAQPDHYKIGKKEIGLIQQKYEQLLAMPVGYLEMALRRFSRSYKYMQHSEYAGTSELDDYWVDLVIALESIASKGPGHITANMARRTAKLLGKSKTHHEKINRKVREIYRQRCSIVHGNEKNEIDDPTHEQRFIQAEALRSLIRDTINASIQLLTDASTSLVDSSGERKPLADLIDEMP